MNAEDDAVFEYALRGKDWNVYWLLLKNGRSMSVREVQKTLRFSSPSVAQHHLEQLRQLGLVKKEEVGGNYSLTSEVKIGVLRHFVKLGRLLVSEVLLLRALLNHFLLFYVFVLMQGFTRENLFILTFGAIVSAIFWFEALRIWSMRPY